jgi:hypothetical protein
MRGYRDRLEAIGHKVVSQWIDYPIVDESKLRPEEWDLMAEDDVNDVASCEMLVAFTESPEAGYMTGGRHVEFGLAIAWRKHAIIIGPTENIFHRMFPAKADELWAMLRRTQYDTFDSFLTAMK